MAEVIGSATYEIDARAAEAGAKRIVASLKSIKEAAERVNNSRTFTGLERFSRLMRELSQLSGIRSGTISSIQNLSSALASFRAPSAVAIRNTQTLLRLLSRTSIPSGGTASTIASLSQAMVGFKAPTSSQTARFQEFLTALRTPVPVQNFRNVANGLRMIADSAERAAIAAGRLNRSLATMNTRVIPQAQTALGRTSRSASQFTNQFGLMNRSILNTVGSLQAFTAILGLRQVVTASANLETARLTIQAVTGDSDAAAEAFDYLVDRSLALGLSLQELGRPFARFTVAAEAAGFSTDQIRLAFDNLTTASRNFGLSAADTAGVVRALEQSLSKGKFMAEEVRLQLGDRLPIAMQAMARATGVATQELSAMFERGELFTDQFFEPFVQALADMSGGQEALARTSQGLNASLQRMSTAFALAADEMGRGGLSQAIKDMSESFVEFTTSDEGERFFQSVGQAARLFGDALSFALQHMEELLYLLGALVALRIGRYFQSIATGSMTTFNRSMARAARNAAQTGVAITAMGRAAIFARSAMMTVFGGPVGFLVTAGLTAYALLGGRMSDVETASEGLQRAQEALNSTLASSIDNVNELASAYATMSDSAQRAERENLRTARNIASEGLLEASNSPAFRMRDFLNTMTQARTDDEGIHNNIRLIRELFNEVRAEAVSLQNDLSAGDSDSITSDRITEYAGDILHLRDTISAVASDPGVGAVAAMIEGLTARFESLAGVGDNLADSLPELAQSFATASEGLETVERIMEDIGDFWSRVHESTLDVRVGFENLAQIFQNVFREVVPTVSDAVAAIDDLDEALLGRDEEISQFVQARTAIFWALQREAITAEEAARSYRFLADSMRESLEPQNVDAQERLTGLRDEISLLGLTATRIEEITLAREREKMVASGVNENLADQIVDLEAYAGAYERTTDAINDGDFRAAERALDEFRQTALDTEVWHDAEQTINDFFDSIASGDGLVESSILFWARLNDSLSETALAVIHAKEQYAGLQNSLATARAEAIAPFTTSIEEQISELNNEILALDATEGHMAELGIRQEALNLAQELGIILTTEETARINSLAVAVRLATDELEKQVDARDELADLEYMDRDAAVSVFSGFAGDLNDSIHAQQEFQDGLTAINILLKTGELGVDDLAEAYEGLRDAYRGATDAQNVDAENRIVDLREEIEEIGLAESALQDLNREREIQALRSQGVNEEYIQEVDLLLRIQGAFDDYTRAIENNDAVAAAASEAELRRLYAQDEAANSVLLRFAQHLENLAEQAGPLGGVLRYIAELIGFISNRTIPELPDLESTLSGIRSGAADSGGDDDSPFEEFVRSTEDRINSLQIEIDTFGMAEHAAAAYSAEMELANTLAREGIELSADEIQQRDELIGRIQSQTLEISRLRAAEDFDNRIQSLQDELAVQQTALSQGQALADTLERELQLRRDLREAGFSPEEIKERVSIEQKYQSQLDAINEQLRTQEELVNSIGKAFQNAFVEAIIKGEELEVVLYNLLQAMAELFLQQALFGLIGDVVGGLIGGLGPGAGAAGGLGNSGSTTPRIGHEGGYVDSLPTTRKAAFVGQLSPGEIPLIAKQGEYIGDPSSFGGGETSIKIDSTIVFQGGDASDPETQQKIQRQTARSLEAGVRQILMKEKGLGGILRR